MHQESTLAIRHGQQRSEFGEHCDAIFTTSSYVFENAAQAAARFAEEEPGYIYSRHTNPTITTLQNRLAALEGGEACIATASGMSAILATFMTLLKQGDHVVSSASLFGTTVSLFNNYLKKFGVHTTFVALTDLSDWQRAITPNTRLLFLETPSNPLIELADISALADLAHNNGCLLVVDNCFCTPILQKPLALGADLVIHSATKYLDGQGRCVGGAVIGNQHRVGEKIFAYLRTCGPTMSPFNAWIFIKGLETLPLRMQAHCRNAQQLAQWLNDHPAVTNVYYPGLAQHPQHQLAQRQQKDFGGMVSFTVRGGRKGAWNVIDNTKLLSITANLGDIRTTITHPATTTHGRLSQEQRDTAGIGDDLLRISVGLESIEDIQRDLDHGLSLV